MEIWIVLIIYAFIAWPFYLGCVALSKRSDDKWARQAFVFAFTSAWPLSMVLIVTVLLLLLIAALWMAVTWRWRREAP